MQGRHESGLAVRHIGLNSLGGKGCGHFVHVLFGDYSGQGLESGGLHLALGEFGSSALCLGIGDDIFAGGLYLLETGELDKVGGLVLVVAREHGGAHLVVNLAVERAEGLEGGGRLVSTETPDQGIGGSVGAELSGCAYGSASEFTLSVHRIDDEVQVAGLVGTHPVDKVNLGNAGHLVEVLLDDGGNGLLAIAFGSAGKGRIAKGPVSGLEAGGKHLEAVVCGGLGQYGAGCGATYAGGFILEQGLCSAEGLLVREVVDKSRIVGLGIGLKERSGGFGTYLSEGAAKSCLFGSRGSGGPCKQLRLSFFETQTGDGP